MAGIEVPTLDDRTVAFSIRRLAEEFGMARETVSKRLADAGVKPAAQRGGFPVYRLRDACPAILTSYSVEDGAGIDPMRMKPADRRAWYQSENERLKFEMETGSLILSSEVQAQMAEMAKIVVRFLETLPDTTERDTRCGPEVIEYLMRKVREVRADIAARLRDEDGDDVRISA